MAVPDTLIRCYSPTCGGAISQAEPTDTVRGEPVHSTVLALCCVRCGRVLATRLRPAGWPNESGPATPTESPHAWTQNEITSIEHAIAAYGEAEFRCGEWREEDLDDGDPPTPYHVLRRTALAAIAELRHRIGLPEVPEILPPTKEH